MCIRDRPKDEWEVELLDTVLFPEGGGQPSDTGALVPLVGGQAGDAARRVNVRQVIRRNLDAVHFVDAPIEVGTHVRVEVDMQRRLDQCVAVLCPLPGALADPRSTRPSTAKTSTPASTCVLLSLLQAMLF